MKKFPAAIVVLMGLLAHCLVYGKEPLAVPRLRTLPIGYYYHGVYPGGTTGAEDDITAEDVAGYEANVGRKVAWIYFSHNWFKGREFPLQTAQWIRARGAVPFIRLMLWSTAQQNRRETLYTLQAIIDGQFDEDLKRWAQSAREFGTPLLVEYGTECNGEWFPWSGHWHGGQEKTRFGDPQKPDGPERFAAAFRHIVGIMRSQGADNIQWVFHINVTDPAGPEWNQPDNYYPGDDVVDWIGVSAYGPQTPMATGGEYLRDMMDRTYNHLQTFAPEKPVVLLEFGCVAGNPDIPAVDWTRKALHDILSNRWPRVIGFSWWNERWMNGEDRRNDTIMRVQDRPDLAAVIREAFLSQADRIMDKPFFYFKTQ